MDEISAVSIYLVLALFCFVDSLKYPRMTSNQRFEDGLELLILLPPLSKC